MRHLIILDIPATEYAEEGHTTAESESDALTTDLQALLYDTGEGATRDALAGEFQIVATFDGKITDTALLKAAQAVLAEDTASRLTVTANKLTADGLSAALERIGPMIADGFTSGRLAGEVYNDPGRGFWSVVNLAEDDDEDLNSDEEDDARGVLDSSELLVDDGPVHMTLEVKAGDPEEPIGRFATIRDAETYLTVSAGIDPDHLEAGHYAISAPHGAGHDDEAVDIAQALGFRLFMSMGSAYYAKKGVSTDHSINPGCKGWSKAYPSIQAAANAANATIDPD